MPPQSPARRKAQGCAQEPSRLRVNGDGLSGFRVEDRHGALPSPADEETPPLRVRSHLNQIVPFEWLTPSDAGMKRARRLVALYDLRHRYG